MSVVTRVSTPTKSGVTPTSVAADIVQFGGPVLAVLEAVEKVPSIGTGVSGSAQAVIAGAVTILTAVMSVLTQRKVAAAAKAAK
jgi:hypothetical protein